MCVFFWYFPPLGPWTTLIMMFWNNTNVQTDSYENSLTLKTRAKCKSWQRDWAVAVSNQTFSPLPRDQSPTEGEGSAAGYSAPWRWVGHVWGTWTLAVCHRSPRSCTRPRDACSQDHSWVCTADRAGDEERGRKEGKHQAGGQRDGVDGRVQRGVTVVISMQKINLLNPLSRGQQLYEKSRSLLSSCKSAGHDFSSVCAITTSRRTPEKSWTLQHFWHHLIWFQFILKCENRVSLQEHSGDTRRWTENTKESTRQGLKEKLTCLHSYKEKRHTKPPKVSSN